jgi:hypothetical protein
MTRIGGGSGLLMATVAVAMLVRMEKVLVAATRRRYDGPVCSAAGALLPDVGGGALVAAVAESNTEGPRFSEAPTNRGHSGKFRGA